MPTATTDYYTTLGVPRTATQKEIKAAFRKLARQNHPDVKPGDAAAEKRFKAASEAYEVLSDEEKRKKYDQFGPNWDNPQAAAGSPFGGGAKGEYRTVSPEEMESMFGHSTDFSGLFDFFGRGGRQQTRARARRGDDLEVETTVTLEEAYRGTTRTVEIGGERGSRRVEIKVPAGIADGGRVRARAQGEAGTGNSAAGDLYVNVHVQPHSRFTRDGYDLRVTVDVPLETALLGGTVRVPTLKGTSVDLNVPAETQNGTRLRLRGLGMAKLGHKDKKTTHGDLYAEVDVRLPVPLTPEQKKWAEQLRAKT